MKNISDTFHKTQRWFGHLLHLFKHASEHLPWKILCMLHRTTTDTPSPHSLFPSLFILFYFITMASKHPPNSIPILVSIPRPLPHRLYILPQRPHREHWPQEYEQIRSSHQAHLHRRQLAMHPNKGLQRRRLTMLITTQPRRVAKNRRWNYWHYTVCCGLFSFAGVVQSQSRSHDWTVVAWKNSIKAVLMMPSTNRYTKKEVITCVCQLDTCERI